MAREGFLVYHDLLAWLEPYGDAERGRLLTAMLRYSMAGEEPKLSGNERFLWPALKVKIDRDIEAYESKCRRMTTNANKRHRKDAIACKSEPTETETETTTETETETATEKKPAAAGRSSAPAERHKYGEFGWVLLSDAQYGKLLAEFGEEELKACIRYVDESAQKTGNKNGWKDWNLVIRNCHRDGWHRRAERRTGYGSGRISGAPEKQEPDWNIVYD